MKKIGSRHTLLATAVTAALVSSAFAAPAAKPMIGTDAPAPMAAPLSLLKRFAANTKGRDFVVGDLHGCRTMLDALLVQIGFDKEVDRLFATGDLGDRGPDSIGCFMLLKEKRFFSVAGNHEELLLRAATDPHFDWALWVAHGGAWATTVDKDQLLELAELVSDMPLCIVVGEGAARFNVIHAEFYGPDEALEDVLENIDTSAPVPASLTWGRALVKGEVDPVCQEGLSLTFSGHSIVEQVSRVGNQIMIDTGAFKAARSGDHSTNCLTIIEPKTARVWRSQPLQ